MSYPINNFFTRSFTHSDVTATTTATTHLNALEAKDGRRIHLLIQNQHASEVLEVILNASGTQGINLAAGATFSIENYCGPVRLKANAGTITTHIAYAVA